MMIMVRITRIHMIIKQEEDFDDDIVLRYDIKSDKRQNVPFLIQSRTRNWNVIFWELWIQNFTIAVAVNRGITFCIDIRVYDRQHTWGKTKRSALPESAWVRSGVLLLGVSCPFVRSTGSTQKQARTNFINTKETISYQVNTHVC